MQQSTAPTVACALLFALFVHSAGCSQASPGDLCAVSMTMCSGGLFCDRWYLGLDVPYRCLQGCERRSDCPGESVCLGAARFDRVPSRGVCDTWGSFTEGDFCVDYIDREDPCGPGLVCNAVGGYRCAPACDSLSPHSEDRVCPDGMICNEGISSGITGQRVCLRRCDLTTRDGCAPFEECLQIAHPQEGVIGVCMSHTLYSCETCPGDQVCFEGTCFVPRDAPPLPWIVSPDVPPLVD